MDLDFSAWGLNAGTVIAISGATGWLKSQIEEFGLPAWTNRFYVMIPFVAAFAFCYLTEPSLTEAIKCAAMYGAAAVVMKNMHRTTIQGK
jgi:hypothetical protein